MLRILLKTIHVKGQSAPRDCRYMTAEELIHRLEIELNFGLKMGCGGIDAYHVGKIITDLQEKGVIGSGEPCNFGGKYE